MTPARHRCRVVRGLLQTGGPTVISHDGRNAYVGGDNALLEFRRDRRTGALTQLAGHAGCISATGRTPGGVGREPPGAPPARGCTRWSLLRGGTQDLMITPDDRTVVLAGFGLRVFRRDRHNGELSPIHGPTGCLGFPSLECGPLRGATTENVRQSLEALAATRDASNVYALADGILVLARDGVTGGLSQLSGPDGCVGAIASCAPAGGEIGFLFSGLAVSPDDRFLYTTSDSLILARNQSNGALNLVGTPSFAIPDASPSDVAISHDGQSAYMTDGAFGLFSLTRDPVTGLLIQRRHGAGCFGSREEVSLHPSCERVTGLYGPYSVGIASDDKTVYAVSDRGIAAFRRTAGGTLRQLAGAAGCATSFATRSCGRTQASALPTLSLSPDGHNLYVTSNGFVNGLISVFQLQ